MCKLAIIGSGVSSIGALKSLEVYIKNTGQLINITIFEESDHPFTGFAYNPSHTQYEHWLNANTHVMQIGGKYSFLKWLNVNHNFCIRHVSAQDISKKLKDKIINNIQNLLMGKDDIYIPRVIYGFFLKDLATEIINNLVALGCQVTILPHLKITGISEIKKSITYRNKFYLCRDPGPSIIVRSAGQDYFFDKVLITAGNTIDISNTSLFLYTPDIKDKIKKLILERVRDNKKSLNIAINHATLAGLDAQRTINECVQVLREQGLIPEYFIINSYTLSNTIAKVPFSNSNQALPDYENVYLNLDYFKTLEGTQSIDPIMEFHRLLKKEMQIALAKFGVSSHDITLFRLKLARRVRAKLSAHEFFVQNDSFFTNITWKNMLEVKEIAFFRYHRKIILNSTLLIYYIFDNYKDKINLKEWEPFLVTNLALSPRSVIKDTLEQDLNIRKFIINQKQVSAMGLSFDMAIDTWTRDPQFEKPLFRNLQTSSNIMIVKLDTALANNGFVAYHKGMEVGCKLFRDFTFASSQFNTNGTSQSQINFT